MARIFVEKDRILVERRRGNLLFAKRRVDLGSELGEIEEWSFERTDLTVEDLEIGHICLIDGFFANCEESEALAEFRFQMDYGLFGILKDTGQL